MGEQKKLQKDQMWSMLFIGAIVLNFCVCSVGLGISSGTPLYIKSIGGTNAYSGILLAAYILSAMCGRFISGRLTDASSRRLVIVIGAIAIIAGSALPLVIPLAGAQFASRILQGLGFACAQTAISAYAADVLPYKRLGEGLGYFGLGQALAMAAGPAFAVWLVSLEYTESLSIGLGCIGVTMLVLGFFVRYEKNPSMLPLQASYRLVWEKRKTDGKAGSEDPAKPQEGKAPERRGFFGRLFEKAALYGSVPAAFFALSTAVFISYATIYAQAMGYGNPSLFFFAAACAAIASRMVSSKLIDTFPPVKLFSVPLICGIGALLVIILIHNELAYYCAGFAYGICVGMALPLLNTVSIKASPTNRYGAANALFYLVYDIGFGLGSAGWGFILDLFGFTAIFAGSIVSFIISFAMAYFLFPRAEKLSQEYSKV